MLVCDNLPPIEEGEITGSLVQSVARSIQGGAGPAGCDAVHWQDVLLGFGAHSSCLRDNIAALARKLMNTIVPWEDLRSLMAGRLVALDKCPGVRPIAVGESLRRIIGKSVCLAVKSDAEEVCQADQLCVGVKAGIEGAIHTLSDLFRDNKISGWGMLSIDAANAFNSFNRISALWNARVLWPRCSRFLFNSYRGWTPLIMNGTTSHLYSKEGMTQGDPLAMYFYGIGTIPLIRSLQGRDQLHQVWYADDASACGSLTTLHGWFTDLLESGPSFGYFPEPSKCVLVVDDQFMDEAKEVFKSFSITVKTSHRLLGGVIGDSEGVESFTESSIDGWYDELLSIINIAESQVSTTSGLRCIYVFNTT